MVLAGLFFAVMTALVRLGSEGLHPFQVAFFRNLFGLAFMLPWLMRHGHTQRLGLLLLRAVIGIATMLTWFWCLSAMPLAQAVSLSFTAPLFVTVGAAVFLNEKVRARRWLATLVGFCGMLIVLRPGVDSIDAPAIAALASAAAMACSIIIIKILVRTESTESVVIYMVIMMTPLSLLPALWVWRWPEPQMWLWMVALGGAGTAGHLLFTRAVQVAEASAIMPFDFVRLPLTAVLAWLIFGQAVDIYTWLGGAVIFAAGIYIARREAQVAVAARRRALRIGGPPTL